MIFTTENISLMVRVVGSLIIAAMLARYRRIKTQKDGHVQGWWDWLNRNPVEFMYLVIFIVVLAPGLIEGSVDTLSELLLEK